MTAVSARPSDLKHVWRELSVSRFSHPSNWGEQGGEAGLYENGDIWGIRIVALEPVSDAVFQKQRHYSLVSNSEERLRILGEFPVRKFNGEVQPTRSRRQSGHQFPGQAAGRRGLDVSDARQERHGAQHGPDVASAAAGRDSQRLRRLPCAQPAADRLQPDGCRQTRLPGLGPDRKTRRCSRPRPTTSRARKWDKDDRTGVKSAGKAVADVEFNRDIKPILDRSCVACHTTQSDEPAGHLALDDASPIKKQGLVPWAENVRVRQGLPRSYARLVQYCWAFQSRRSPLIWKVLWPASRRLCQRRHCQSSNRLRQRAERARLVPPQQAIRA